MNNVHSVALSPLTKVLLDRNHGILDLISSRGGVSQLHRENITEGLYDLVKNTPQAITSPSPNINTTARDACKLKEPCIYHLLNHNTDKRKQDPGS